MQQVRKILVVGGTGYIGEYVTKMLQIHSNVTVAVIGLESHDTYDSNLIDDIIWLARPDGLAIADFFTDSVTWKNLKSIVYASTALLYKDELVSHDENGTIDPLQPYEKLKFKEEQWIRGYASNLKVSLLITRFANVYGGVKNRGIVYHMMHALISNNTLTINGDGDIRRDFIFIEDLVDHLEYLLFNIKINDFSIYNICTGKQYSVNEIIAALEKVSGKKLKVVHGAAIIEKKNMSLLNDSIVKLSGFAPKHNLIEGLTKTYNTSLKTV